MNSLNRPISPTLINKCIGVALLPVAVYMIWKGAESLMSFSVAFLVSDLLFVVLPSACLLTVAVFCVLFVLKAFRSEPIKKPAIVMAFLEIACTSFLVVLNSWMGDPLTLSSDGDAGFAFAVLYLWAFFLFYVPVVIIATVCAVIGMTSLSRPIKAESKRL